MRCPYCNYELPENSKFCERCGQEISVQNSGSQNAVSYWKEYQDQSSKADNEYRAALQRENQTRKTRRLEAFIASVVIVLIFALILGSSVVKKNKMNAMLAEAAELAAEQNYEAAYRLMAEATKRYPKSQDMKKRAEEYGDAWVTATLAESKALATDGDYAAARAVAKKCLTAIPESKYLKQRVKICETQLNKQICNTYTGTYSTGTTKGFDLQIISCDAEGQVRAVFSFYSVDSSDMLFGQYEMTGYVVRYNNDGSMEVSLASGDWIVQPSGFNTIDFDIEVNADHTQITSDEYALIGSIPEPGDYKSLVKLYSGTYKPNWGDMDLDLRILSCTDSGIVKAEFSFYKKSQPSFSKTGKYAMIGKIVEIYPDGSLRIDLIGYKWIDKPANGVKMIDFSLIINAQRDSAYSDDYEIKLVG